MKVGNIDVDISDEHVLAYVNQIGSGLNNFLNEMMPILDKLVSSPSTANVDEIILVTSAMDTEIFSALPSKDEEFEDLL